MRKKADAGRHPASAIISIILLIYSGKNKLLSLVSLVRLRHQMEHLPA